MTTRTRKTTIGAVIIAAWIISAHLTGFWTPNEPGTHNIPCYTCIEESS